MEIANIDDAISQLKKFWRKQKIVFPPNSIEEILHIEFSKSIKLPNDFRQFYMMTNGMGNYYPNEIDNEGYLFYPLQKLTTLEEEFEMPRVSYVEYIVIFAEYMHKSWWYGARFSKYNDEYEIGIIPNEEKFKVITQSLGEFIHFYMNDASILYDYE